MVPHREGASARPGPTPRLGSCRASDSPVVRSPSLEQRSGGARAGFCLAQRRPTDPGTIPAPKGTLGPHRQSGENTRVVAEACSKDVSLARCKNSPQEHPPFKCFQLTPAPRSEGGSCGLPASRFPLHAPRPTPHPPRSTLHAPRSRGPSQRTRWCPPTLRPVLQPEGALKTL